MNPVEPRPSPIDDVHLDRLVDGHLAGADRRGLLLALDRDPDGWRRCALAFLEDQAWRQALAVAPRPSAGLIEVAVTAPPRPRRSPRRLSLAAGVIAATFAAGFAVGGASRGPDAVELVHQDAPKPDVAPSRPPLGEEAVREVGWINLVDPSAGETPPRRVPILSGPGLDERWLRDRPPAVSDYQRARWERQGYQVEEHRRLVSVVLDDGRRVSIPVDEVAVEYVGQQPF